MFKVPTTAWALALLACACAHGGARAAEYILLFLSISNVVGNEIWRRKGKKNGTT